MALWRKLLRRQHLQTIDDNVEGAHRRGSAGVERATIQHTKGCGSAQNQKGQGLGHVA